ncbi:MAG: Ribosomal large subunit pseudouridine synthase D [Spirochaetes bacterium ADurb.Bin218]|nr:MAG: Ribosomal large subunit pseudouridine synthase D [Spirochaetes bacterium ADurb.Bin218]
MYTKKQIVVPEEYEGERIDRFLACYMEDSISRSMVQKLIKSENILVNGKLIKPSYSLSTDDEIEVTFPQEDVKLPFPEDLAIDIIYQDDDIVVINKAPGIVVHLGPGNYEKTLVNALLFHIKKLSAAGDPTRPGIVHRLDRDTAGLMVVAKSDAAYYSLVEQFSHRQVIKIYKAVVTGKPPREEDLIDKPIARHKKYREKMCISEDGREALTQYKVEKVWHKSTGVFSLLTLRILTGRTHQIRVHLSSIGNPVVGDPVYSKKWSKFNVPYLLLGATYLSFKHPAQERLMEFEVPLPSHIVDFIEKLESRD